MRGFLKAIINACLKSELKPTAQVIDLQSVRNHRCQVQIAKDDFNTQCAILAKAPHHLGALRSAMAIAGILQNLNTKSVEYGLKSAESGLIERDRLKVLADEFRETEQRIIAPLPMRPIKRLGHLALIVSHS